MHTNSGLILTRNIMPACQIRSLIESREYTADIVLSDLDAYSYLNQHGCRFLICDIDDSEIQGMAVAGFYHRFHGAPWYAICRHGNSQNMRLAREYGAAGYFYLNSAGLALDPHAGMTRNLLSKRAQPAKPVTHYLPGPYQLHPSY